MQGLFTQTKTISASFRADSDIVLYHGKPSGNPKGKNPSDVWQKICTEWEEGFWEIPNVKSNHPEKTVHPCQFPIELVERCVLALTHEWANLYISRVEKKKSYNVLKSGMLLAKNAC